MAAYSPVVVTAPQQSSSLVESICCCHGRICASFSGATVDVCLVSAPFFPFHHHFGLFVPEILMILNLNAKYAPGCCIFPSRAGNNDYSLQGHSGGRGGEQLANKIIYEMCNIFATSSGSHLYCCFLFYLANCSSVEISRGVRKLVDCLQVTTSGRCSPATARRW